ncbi:MAG: hypothetical protein JOZ00_11060 [Mycobacterium sp.]|uniref:hypothetical protein n=1 Tax=Mycobacterium sp. TaxID=1785 RepID=UPI001EBF7B4D|nr:hypothetical protein [Mycobacterium sp.]MBV8787217.1 hypothetical protein [Mycobacterium sp.]
MIVLLTAVVLAGCGGSAAKPRSAHRPAPAQTFTYADNGRTVTLGVGRRALVKLDTLDWYIDAVSGSALRAVGPQRSVHILKGCGAPQGCGYMELTVDAVAPGRSVVRAQRGLCGELFICPRKLRKFALTVVVH